MSEHDAPTTAPEAVLDLVRRFELHREAYRAGVYNETQIRREFIDPLFKALGWDVDNTAGYAEAYKDVIHEAAVKVGGATKAPDYSFRIGGQRKFFVEAKKPSIDIRDDPSPAFQLRRYAWSAKLPLSILTDFEETAVYDCRVRPVRTDKASKARILYLRYDELASRWHELADVFTREAILKGSFDKFAASAARKKGTAEVDDAFLAEIESWRDSLARHVALRNPGLSQRDLNFAVQRTIDRIIFLRICEDRGIERYGTLQALLNGPEVYARLFERFRRADERYNSGLFHFLKEKDRPEAPDDLTPGLVIDDKPLKEILTRLYYPESPYEFAVLPADILGQVYEQFLGKVIRLTAGHRAVVEEKPEVRKAGGVYYTPTYIVDYIVQHTVGKLLEGKTPQEIGGLTETWKPAKNRRPLSVLDPACGSGSFLLGAYQFLLDWYRDWYVRDGPEKHAAGRVPRLFQHGSGEWRLTSAERKRILLAHIYGVDIDSQAVETTKLSLLLKVLEGENAETLGANLRLFHERALPDLADNIKCGNSLIGPDFYNGQQLTMFDEEERLRINVFDWHAEFKDIMKAGGFDAVIGNPPYLSFSGRQAVDLSDEARRYYEARYSTGGWPTSHGLFIERAVRDLSLRIVSFIVPDQVGHLDGYRIVRDTLEQGSRLAHVRYWGEKVFTGVTTPALTFVADRGYIGPTTIVLTDGTDQQLTVASGSKWTAAKNDGLLQKLQQVGRSLGEMVADPGVHTGNCSGKLILPLSVPGVGVVPVLEGKQVSRYRCESPVKGVQLQYKARSGEYFTIRPKDRYVRAEFVIRQTAPYPIVGPREHADYFRNSLLALYPPPPPLDIRFFVGLLNSRVIRFVYCATVQESQQKAFPQVKVRSLRQLPIYWPEVEKQADQRLHDRIVELVQCILDLHKQLAGAKTAHARTATQRQIDATDRQIDRLVYELYGLTADEIRIVEEAT